jgi:hypothetical protein
MKLAYIFNTGTKYYYDEYFEKTDNFKAVFEKAWIESRLSRKQFCKKLSISSMSFSRWINGDIPRRDLFDQIKMFLD